MIAIGINERGIREVIGFDAYENESKETWNAFFRSLKDRGLKGVKMITSDAHDGILYAMMQQYPEVPWQRCQYHFTKNIVEKAPKKYQEGLRSELRTMFTASDLKAANQKMSQIAQDYRDVAEDAVKCLEKGFLDSMTNLTVPKELRTYIRTSNHIERLNKELKRRSKVIGVFPNVASLLRLMGSVLVDHHDKWSTKKRIFYAPMYTALTEKSADLEAIAKKQHDLYLAA